MSVDHHMPKQLYLIQRTELKPSQKIEIKLRKIFKKTLNDYLDFKDK